MTKEAAVHSFFNSFGIPAYTTASVPEDAVFPWLTYELITNTWDEGEVGMTVNLWYYGSSEAIPNEKVREISERIGMGGVQVPCDGGTIWFKRGSPWCQNVKDDTDTNIKRRYINISAEYQTMN